MKWPHKLNNKPQVWPIKMTGIGCSFYLLGSRLGERRVIFEKIRHFCFLQVLAKILLDLCSAKLGDKRVLYPKSRFSTEYLEEDFWTQKFHRQRKKNHPHANTTHTDNNNKIFYFLGSPLPPPHFSQLFIIRQFLSSC